jgi:MSHA type pilus biogenesis protein MshL
MQEPAQQEREFPRYHDPETWPGSALVPIDLSASQRLSFPQPVAEQLDKDTDVLYSFVINNLPVKEGLRMFARAYDLNIMSDEDVTGVLDVEFRDMPLEKALSFMLGSLDYYWEENDGVIRVRSQETRRITVEYLRLVRSGSGSSQAKVSSSSSSGSGSDSGGDSGEESGSINITHEDEIHFWAELEEQLQQLLSASGRVVVNRLSGTVQVTDQHAYVEGVARYIDHINRAIHRQVDIEVRILEVVLSDSTALGVNWSRVSQVLDSGVNVDFNIDGIVSSPAGGIAPLSSVFSLGAANIKNDGNLRIAAVIEALEEQGDVEIVSQPHVRTLNNQTSMIKVGTDRTFFRREQSTDSTSAGSLTTATDVAQVVTEGVVLSITPQIGERGWIMMDVSPVVTRVSSVSVVEGPNGTIQSSAPNLDVAQVSSLVRARSGETIVLGGLIQTQTSLTKRGIPGLTRLGPLSRVLGGQYDSQVRKELIMILTPKIVASGG